MSTSNRKERPTIGQIMDENGVGRRRFLKYCAGITALMAMPPGMTAAFAQQLRAARRPTVIYMPFQECTGCLESLTRSFAPSLESLIFETISLDYNHTLQAAAGHAAEEARHEAMKEAWGEYILICDGSIPTKLDGIYGASAGHSFVDQLHEAAEGAASRLDGDGGGGGGGDPGLRARRERRREHADGGGGARAVRGGGGGVRAADGGEPRCQDE